MASKYLSQLSKSEYNALTESLLKQQNHKCYICQKPIDPSQDTNIDHIVPLANNGKDKPENFAVTHASCNKSKQDADLDTARMLARLKSIQEKVAVEHRSASLADVLAEYGGSKYDFHCSINENELSYSFDQMGEVEMRSIALFKDKLSSEKSCFIEVPIEYLFHDCIINPRGINSSISLLVKEFKKGNPQLHLTLGRLEEGKIKIFDGQHKAVARILLGERKILIRLFVEPNVDRLTLTNATAGSTLRQIAFDKSIMRQLNNTLYQERVRKYQEEHNLPADCYDFSEANLVDYFKGISASIKKYIIDAIKSSITNSPDNSLKDYIDFEGKAKSIPISHSTFDKVFLSQYIDAKSILTSKISDKSDAGENPRELDITQIVQLMNIIAEEIYINKFNPDIGVYRIENQIIDGKDANITDAHLIAYRMSKEEIAYNWNQYIKRVIRNYFDNVGGHFNEKSPFQSKFPDRLWLNLRNFVRNLAALPLWKDRSMAETHFAGKSNYDYWKTIFETGKTNNGEIVLQNHINISEMIKDDIVE